MANNASARKRVRQIAVRTERNKGVNSRLKTFRKKLAVAVEGGDAKEIQAAYNTFASAADRAAKKKIIHKNAAGRLKSRAAASIKAASS